MRSMTTGAETSPQWSDATTRSQMWDRYRALAGCYDELMAAENSVRRHWQPFVDAMELLGGDEIRRRWEESQDLIRENGVTYNVYGDPRGTDRPWQLDPIPLLMSPGEWRVLEDGLIQRAMLLDMILADLYGPQRLLRRGLSASRAGLRQPGIPASLPWHAGSLPTATCIYTRPTWAAWTMARSWCWATARRRHRGPVTRWRTGSSCRACCPKYSATAWCSGWPPSSGRSATPCNRSPRTTATIPASSC